MLVNDVEAAFRDRMRALAHKGGAVTKRRYANDPWHYRDIGRLGGRASVAAWKARIVAELDEVEPGEAPVFEPTASLAEAPIAEPIDTAPDTYVTTRSPITITEVFADRKRFGPRRPEVSERQRILDAIAEEHLARVIAGVREAHEQPEPWDPWS
jgi:general stress protein YciG